MRVPATAGRRLPSCITRQLHLPPRPAGKPRSRERGRRSPCDAYLDVLNGPWQAQFVARR